MRPISFLNFIRLHFGMQSFRLLKDYMNTLNSIINVQFRIRFLRSCINQNLVPTHLRFMLARQVYLFNTRSRKKFLMYSRLHINRMLKIEVSDAYSHLHYLRTKIFKLFEFIYNALPLNLCCWFLSGQEKRFHKLWSDKSFLTNKKLDGLASKQMIEQKANIRPLKFSIFCDDNLEQRVDISPHNFNEPSKLDTLKDGWFLNLSNSVVPKKVQLLLQLGDRFNLPLIDKKSTAFEFLKCVEKNIEKKNIEIRSSVRGEATKIIRNMCWSNKKSQMNRTLIDWFLCTREFLNEHNDVLITRADKGSITVALNKNEYINKMNIMLADTQTYSVIEKNPIKKITDNLRQLLFRWKQNNYINEVVYRQLLITDGLIPRAYGLPKIHKDGVPLRLIVSSVNSPLHNLATYLHKILFNNLETSKYAVKNSFQLIDKIKHIVVEPGYCLASLDVVSLFTNVPIDLANNCIIKRWRLISRGTSLPMNEFLSAINLVLSSTFFMFNDCFYKQIFGAPMGSPLSPIIADLVLQDLETIALNRLPCELPIYIRYVDDVLLLAPENDLDDILSNFNSLHNRIRFTLEIGVNNNINFLNVNIAIIEKGLIFDLFHKPTCSHRFLNFHSQHPLVHKKSIIIHLVDKILRLSHPKFYQKNLTHMITILLNNSFPLDLLFTTINSRLKSVFNNNNNKNKNRVSNSDNKLNNSSASSSSSLFVIPYIKGVSEKFNRLKRFGFKLVYSCKNKLNKIIKTGKDKLDPLSHCDVVYKISCNDCDASYVGQTKRRLLTRIREHRSNINKRSGSPSVISSHRLEFNHEFDWDGAKILDREQSYGKRLFSEMIHIKNQDNGLNKQVDTEMFPDTYLPILQLFK